MRSELKQQKQIVRRDVVSANISPAALSENHQALHPVVARVLAARGIRSLEQCDYRLQRLLSPKKLKGLQAAVDILSAVVIQQKRLCIVGDFDADGATSTALCMKVLTAMGLQNCEFIVPNRFEYGYGLTPEIVELANQNAPDILLTVDNGISSIDGVALAKKLGMKVVITDHHLPGEQIPEADAIVNPNQPGCEFPSKHLAGVGVAFYVLSALRARLREENWFTNQQIAEPNMADYLDLVALGTVADVVPLDDNNRILVEQGLKRIRAGKSCPGINAILYVARKNISGVTAGDLSFAIGPRLNAAGRLDDMSLGIQCLLSSSVFEAEKLARELDDLNRERRAIEAGMQKEALMILEKWNSTSEENAPAEDRFAISLYDATWHEGVVGILASRIKDKLHRPTIIFAETDSGQLKGSGRSIPGVHLRDVLDELATRNPGLLKKFGGHAMAAGLTIEAQALKLFESEFDRTVAKALGGAQPRAQLLSDGELLEDDLDLSTAMALRKAGPWGQAFPEPLFDGEFTIVQYKHLNGGHLKLSVSPSEYSGLVLDAIWFNCSDEHGVEEAPQRVHMAYKLDVNQFRGETRAQLMVEQLAVLDGV